jgi:hypothetical protein
MSSQKGDGGEFTSHIFLSLKNDEGVSSMGLLLLVRLLVRVCINNDANLNRG